MWPKKAFLILLSLILIAVNTACRDMVHDIDEIATEAVAKDSFSMVAISDVTNKSGYDLRPYKINRYETSYALWYEVRSFAEKNGYSFGHKGKQGATKNSGKGDENRYKPVVYISVQDCIVWCNAFSKKKNLTPCYYFDSEFTEEVKSSTEQTELSLIKINENADGFRLPTESEWKYAAYGAFRTKADEKYIYSGSNNLEEVAVCFHYSGPATIGTKKANGLGIFDMTGNVSEICISGTEAKALGGHCMNDSEIYLKLPGTDLYTIRFLYPLIGFRFVQKI